VTEISQQKSLPAVCMEQWKKSQWNICYRVSQLKKIF